MHFILQIYNMSNSDNSDNMSSLEDLFKAEIKKPFHYKLSLTDVNNNNHEISSDKNNTNDKV